jgi:hypothetical protein
MDLAKAGLFYGVFPQMHLISKKHDQPAFDNLRFCGYTLQLW